MKRDCREKSRTYDADASTTCNATDISRNVTYLTGGIYGTIVEDLVAVIRKKQISINSSYCF